MAVAATVVEVVMGGGGEGVQMELEIGRRGQWRRRRRSRWWT